jgi:hypothetical protein
MGGSFIPFTPVTTFATTLMHATYKLWCTSQQVINPDALTRMLNYFSWLFTKAGVRLIGHDNVASYLSGSPTNYCFYFGIVLIGGLWY